MEDKLKTTAGDIQPAAPELTTYNNYGKGVQVGHADTFSPTINLIVTGANGQQSPANVDYYNLFVGFDPFSSDHFLMPKDRVLTEYITDELRSRFGGLDDSAIAEIKGYRRSLSRNTAKALQTTKTPYLPSLRIFVSSKTA